MPWSRNKQLWWIPLILLLAGCGNQQPAETKKPAPKRQPPEHLVELLSVQPRPSSSTHTRTGSLMASRNARLYNQEEGQVLEVRVHEGDRVKKGDLLLLLDDRLLQAQLEKAQATSRQARLDLKRLSNLVKRRAVSEEEQTRAATALEVALAEQKLLETRLRYTRISAPFDGVISQRRVEPGDVVARYSHLLSLLDPQSLVVELQVSELLLPQLAIDDPVSLQIDALGGERFPGRILRIHPQLDARTRQGVVEVAPDPVPAGARAGQFARASFSTRQTARILVPFHALQRDRQGEFLYLVGADQKAEQRRVRSGLRIADSVEIIEGLEPGDKVITRGFLGLRSGITVVAVAADAENAQ